MQCSAVLQYNVGQSCSRLVHQKNIKIKKIKKIMETERRKKQKVCHHRPKLAICSLSRTFFNLRKCVSCDGTDTQTDIYTDAHGNSMTNPAQRAESVKSTGLVLCLMLLWWWNLWSRSINTLGSQPYYSHVTSLCGEPWRNMFIFLTHFTLYLNLFFSIFFSILLFVSGDFQYMILGWLYFYLLTCVSYKYGFFWDFLILKTIFTKILLKI